VIGGTLLRGKYENSSAVTLNQPSTLGSGAAGARWKGPGPDVFGPRMVIWLPRAAWVKLTAAQKKAIKAYMSSNTRIGALAWVVCVGVTCCMTRLWCNTEFAMGNDWRLSAGCPGERDRKVWSRLAHVRGRCT
jgi:hypothetical protein